MIPKESVPAEEFDEASPDALIHDGAIAQIRQISATFEAHLAAELRGARDARRRGGGGGNWRGRWRCGWREDEILRRLHFSAVVVLLFVVDDESHLVVHDRTHVRRTAPFIL